MSFRILLLVMMLSVSAFAQAPPIEPGVSRELAEWRSVRYSNVRYKLDLTLEKMSPVLKGTMEIKLQYAAESCAECPPRFIVLDWRKIRGHEDKSTISNVSINGKTVQSASFRSSPAGGETSPGSVVRDKSRTLNYSEQNEHLIFSDGVEMGENVITLDFTSPILTSGSAITRYVDKEDGSEYLYSLFVPSDASTAFPVFDQPDIKAKFSLRVHAPMQWKVVSNAHGEQKDQTMHVGQSSAMWHWYDFTETKPISSYVFAFAAGPFERMSEPGAVATGLPSAQNPVATAPGSDKTSIYVRKSQAAKFKPHAVEVFRLNREAVKYFEGYFDYKFPFPKYDLVLIPEFPFGGMEHAGATFLRESSIIFPQEPTKNDHISRATLIFHEAAHQWFGDTVTMRWFDDLWLKEGFATFTAYKAMERIMPEMNAWKVFYERVKQAAYQTDSTRGTTAIYQPIANLSAAKSAYGNIVYNKAPAFLRQAEFYLGEDKFQSAVRAFLKKHEFGNAGWEDLLNELAAASGRELKPWGEAWIRTRGGPRVKSRTYRLEQYSSPSNGWPFKTQVYWRDSSDNSGVMIVESESAGTTDFKLERASATTFVFPNYGDYGYGIFLLDAKSREYVLKNIQNEKDPFLRSMMWGALWDSVREGELEPREYVELVVRVLMQKPAREQGLNAQGSSQALANARASATEDESTTALLLNRVGTAMNYYLSEPGAVATGFRSGSSTKNPVATAPGSDLPGRIEDMLISGMRKAPTQGQRITYYRAFLNIAGSENARKVLKEMLTAETQRRGDVKRELKEALRDAQPVSQIMTKEEAEAFRRAEVPATLIPLKSKDKFDIVTKLLILNDPEAPRLLAELEKTETSDDAKRYAYAAKAGIPTAENKARYWNDFVNNKEISESWIEAAFGPWNSIRHSGLTLPYLERALKELPNHKRSRKIFFVNGWLGAFIGGQRSADALRTVNKFLADDPNLDNDLRLKILENVDVIERAVKIRAKYKN